MKDIIIVGGGTAGLTAAIYARRAGKSVLVIEADNCGGQIINTPEIENYPGIKNISGLEFANGLKDQAEGLGAVIESAKVTGLDIKDGKVKILHTTAGDRECLAVILATGAKNRHLGLENEEEFTGCGVSYCATCDGAFFKDSVVAVNGGGNTAIEDAFFLSNYCSKVYLIHRRDAFRADAKEVAKLKAKENVEFILNSTITALCGNGDLEYVELENTLDHKKSKLEIEGLFIAIGQTPDNKAFADYVTLDEKGYIVAGEDCKTATKGIFAAGDCRTKSVRQLTTAAADGAVAALAAVAYCG
ncbi:MAG: FAD-dependent oxidoreductase [Lachnospiraceae bacterium]|nr:FAD-dependent oxidoreductase [Lachnospiraceae bacterium]